MAHVCVISDNKCNTRALRFVKNTIEDSDGKHVEVRSILPLGTQSRQKFNSLLWTAWISSAAISLLRLRTTFAFLGCHQAKAQSSRQA